MRDVVIRIGGFGQIRNLGLAPKRRLIDIHDEATIKREVFLFELTEYRNFGIETDQILSFAGIVQMLNQASIRPWIVFGGVTCPL